MFYIFCLLGCLLGATGEVQAKKTCTDFDKDNKVLGTHSAWVLCESSDGANGTVNSCDCSASFSPECSQACQKAGYYQKPQAPNSAFAVALGL